MESKSRESIRRIPFEGRRHVMRRRAWADSFFSPTDRFSQFSLSVVFLWTLRGLGGWHSSKPWCLCVCKTTINVQEGQDYARELEGAYWRDCRRTVRRKWCNYVIISKNKRSSFNNCITYFQAIYLLLFFKLL